MRTVLVTGASGGLGRITVRRLAANGWRVLAGVRSPGATEDLDAAPIRLDVTDGDSISAARVAVAEHVGGDGLQGLVNNAGLSVDGPVEILDLERLSLQFAVNVIGPVAVSQEFLPLLRTGGGRIVNIGGAAGRMPLPMYGALSASKAALDALSAALRMELKYQGVSVSYVEPSALETGFFETAAEARCRGGTVSNPEADARYSAAIEAAAAAVAKSPAIPPERAARAIERALTERRPRARYVVGRDARLALPVLRLLPDRARDLILLSSLGLRKHLRAGPSPV
jgi:NAD(P)-dependent dehydrogenase (short-subunit alcohol dehydrogenase family)